MKALDFPAVAMQALHYLNGEYLTILVGIL